MYNLMILKKIISNKEDIPENIRKSISKSFKEKKLLKD
jgi:uncharacterized protein (UPF0147 family)